MRNAVLALAVATFAVPAAANEFIQACTIQVARSAPKRIPPPEAENIARTRCSCIARHLDLESQSKFARIAALALLPPGDPRSEELARPLGTQRDIAKLTLSLREKNAEAAKACDREPR